MFYKWCWFVDYGDDGGSDGYDDDINDGGDYIGVGDDEVNGVNDGIKMLVVLVVVVMIIMVRIMR